MKNGYIRVTNWTRYQHYKDRRPPWVKLYVDLADPRNKINELPVTTRFLFDRILLLAAEYANAIPNDPELIAKVLRMRSRDVREGLAELAQGKWISHSKTRRRASKAASKNAPSENREQRTEKASASAFGNLAPSPLREVVDIRAANAYGLEGAIIDLVRGLPDRDERTEAVVRKLVAHHRLGEGAVRTAIEAARGPGVLSPTRVAVSELKRCAERKGAA